MISTWATLSILSLLAGGRVMGSMDLKCTRSAKLDLQLIVDSSLSVGKEKFKLLMEEIADRVVGQFDIGKGKTRVSLFKYSSSKVMVEEFELDAHTDAASLKKAIKATKFVGGYTLTATAMQKALTHYSAKMRSDTLTAKACIVFTDGEASDKHELPAALKAWESKGIKVFAVGIGLKIDAAGLKGITGSANRFIQVPSIEAFSESAAWSLLVKVCEEAIVGKLCRHEDNIDYDNNDIRNFFVHNIEACEEACLQEEKCVGFAFDKRIKDGKHECWLKNKLANGKSHNDIITGHCTKVVEITKSSKITASTAYNIGLIYSPSTLVDGCKGDKSTSLNLNKCCFHTKKSGWVLFQFDKPRFINEVVIYNRVDCCKERLFPFEILVTDEAGHVHKCQGKAFDVGAPEIPSAAMNPISVKCGNLKGNSVKLVGKVNEYLNICEVEIYGY